MGTPDSTPQPVIRTCIDKYMPKDDPFLHPDLFGRKAAAETSKMWAVGERLRISFMDGDEDLQQKVIDAAKEWCKYANIVFDFGIHDDPQIRISFEYDPGNSWSWIGKEALERPAVEPTLNLGWLRPDWYPETDKAELQRVVQHEFGHVLGLIHEHQNPDIAGKIEWNKPAVYAHYAKQGWSEEKVDVNIFQVYGRDITRYAKFDAQSIMLYPIDPEMTLDNFWTPFNMGLSQEDINFVKKYYPGKA